LETSTVEIKDLKYKLDHSSRYTILSPPCKACVSLKGKLFHAIKENTELQQEVTYLTSPLEKIVLSEKMIEENLTRVEKCATKSTYRLDIILSGVRIRVRRVLPSSFPSPPTMKRSSNQIHQSSLLIEPKVILQPKERSKERNSQA
jgi:hypothetical protein